jgi:hypothetical protein
MTKLMSYKYMMRSSKQRFTIFIIYCIYIFKASLYRIFLYFIFLKIYLFKHRRVLISIKENFLQVLVTNYLDLPSIKYMLSNTFTKKNR